HQHQDQQGLLHRRPSLHEEALAEREYVVIEKRTVEMNFLADEMESSPRTPLTLYPPPPLPSNMHRAAPGVAKQMTVLARAIRHAVIPQNKEGFSAAEANVEAALGVRGFNPLDQELAETFEASGCLDVQEEMTMRRMEGLAYMAFAMAFLADMKWRQLPNNTPAAAVVPAVDALVDPENGYLSAGDISLEEAFALYLRALSLLQHAMREAGNHWAGLSANSPVSFRFNAAVQWVRTKFNQCLERAEALKLFGNGRIMELAGVEVVQVLYEQSLALGKVAALRELKWVEPLDCDRAYQLAIWMLSAILETTTVEEDGAGMGFDAGESAGEAEEIEMEDRTIVEQFIASIVKRREKLQKRLMQQQDNIN
ncbi:Serine/threonine-protein kinase, partial [Kickxella alabastrina]